MRCSLAIMLFLIFPACYESAPTVQSDAGRDPAVDPVTEPHQDAIPDLGPDGYPDIYTDRMDVPPSCPPGLTLCGGLCVDTVNDPMHCGACYSECPEGSRCSLGTCFYGDPCEGVACRDGETCCHGLCVDTNRDRYNCGGCDSLCPWGGDPDLSYLGCLDLGMGVYNLCCGGRCLPVDSGHCGDCSFDCGTNGTCMGAWDVSTGSCSFLCGGITSGSVGDPCGDPAVDCALVPGDARQCLTDFMGFVYFYGGYCTASCTGPADCGPGATCVELPMGSFCFKNCSGDDECRVDEGYACTMMPYLDAGPYCLPVIYD